MMRLIRRILCGGAAALAVHFLPSVQVLAQVTSRPDTVRATLSFMSGDDVHNPGLFSVVTGIAAAPDGRIAVSDGSQAQLVILDARGNLLGTVGRRGPGPAEFEFPVGPAWISNDRLLIRDVRGVTIFRMPATGVKGYRYESMFAGPMMPSSTGPSRIDVRGRLYYPYEVMGRSEPSRYFYVVYDLDGRLLDTVPVPQYDNHISPAAWVKTGPSGGRIVKGLNAVPFGRRPSWDVSRTGSLWASDGKEYTITELDTQGRVLRRLASPGSDQPIPRAERDDSLRALGRRLDSLPVSPSLVRGLPADVRDKKLPVTYPPVTQVIAGSDGRLWVKRWATKGSAFDVFNVDGRLVATVTSDIQFSDEVSPFVTGTTLTGLVIDASGAHMIAQIAFRLPK